MGWAPHADVRRRGSNGGREQFAVSREYPSAGIDSTWIWFGFLKGQAVRSTFRYAKLHNTISIGKQISGRPFSSWIRRKSTREKVEQGWETGHDDSRQDAQHRSVRYAILSTSANIVRLRLVITTKFASQDEPTQVPSIQIA